MADKNAKELDLYETEKEIVVRVNVAGVDEKDMDINLENGQLMISAIKKEEGHDPQRKHYSKSTWSYSYKITLPSEIDEDQEPDATVKNGVLTIVFKRGKK